MIPIRYLDLCPICNGTLDEVKIENMRCGNVHFTSLLSSRYVEDFSSFFNERTRKKLRRIQRVWVKRFFDHESFAMVSPTGSGKTLLGISLAAFLSKRNKKSYLIFPTHLLVENVVNKFKEYYRDVDILYYHSKMSKKEREEAIKMMQNGSFDVLITTNQFMAKHFNDLGRFDFVFVDDVDAILKASKNVERVLQLLGFSYDEIRNGQRSKPLNEYGQLIVSTATAVKGKKASLFSKLLNFWIGGKPHGIRDVYDIVLDTSLYDKDKVIVDIIRTLGYGGVVYTQTGESAERVDKLLKSNGIRSSIVISGKTYDFSKFIKGEIDVLIGVSSPYGLLVRGLDYPYNFRYSIFYDPPIIKRKLDEIDDRMRQKLISWIKIFNKLNEADDEVWKKFTSGEVKFKGVVIRDNYLIFPDVKVYVQATGRTSRIFYGGVTKGASFVFADRNLIDALKHRFEFLDIHFVEFNDVDLNNIKLELIKSREALKNKEIFDIIPVLFIVESPTKAKEIASFFGKPSIRFVDGIPVYETASGRYVISIMASIGHLVDLTSDPAFKTFGIEVNGKVIPYYRTIKRCLNCGYQFTDGNVCPICKSNNIDDALKRVNVIRKLAYEAEHVFIGTDPDNEGEKIAFDILNLLTPVVKSRRLEFHEITPSAIRKAMAEPRDIDMGRVKAQITRRIEDRIIGFALSSLLKRLYKRRNLSAGRAQTPVLKWIIDAWKMHRKKIKSTVLNIEGHKVEITNGVISEIVEDGMELDVIVKLISKKRVEEPPLPPYTTDVILSDASRYLHFSSSKTMRLLQDLFESGLITYHRTDSIHVSEKGMSIAKTYLGESFVGRRWSKEGTHEAIRPTRPYDKQDIIYGMKRGILSFHKHLSKDHLNLYNLIFKRFMASQMSNYDVEYSTFEIYVMNEKIIHTCITDVSGDTFKMYPFKYEVCGLRDGTFKSEVAIYEKPMSKILREGDIVRLMKERGIGRPSTYSTIIDKIKKRGYVKTIKDKFYPTRLGISVANFLLSRFRDFVGEEMTKRLEDQIDLIEDGGADYTYVIKSFINSFESLFKRKIVKRI